MKYVADLLTLFRAVVAIALVFTIANAMWVISTTLFILAILSDALDGVVARKWPYTKEENARLFWRRDSHVLDEAADGLLTATVLIALAVVFPVWRWGLLVVGIGTIGFHWFINHFSKTKPKLAERIDVFNGWTYALTLLASLTTLTFMATPFWLYALIVYAITGGLLVYAKWDRATSRKEVEYSRSK